jgi:predicted transcriptional regulator
MARKSTRVRDAKTGRFVPNEEAKKRPSTTVTETIKVGPTKKRGKK